MLAPVCEKFPAHLLAQKHFPNTLNMKTFLSMQLSHLETFREVNTSKILYNKLRHLVLSQLLSSQYLLTYESRLVSVHSVVSYATGQILLSSLLQPSTFPVVQELCQRGYTRLYCAPEVFHEYKYNSNFGLMFQVDKRLRLNLTFSSMSFSSGSSNFDKGDVPCAQGLLEIKFGTQATDNDILTFCGHVSHYSVFPLFPNMAFILSVLPLTKFCVAGSYMVQDKGVVCSILAKKEQHCKLCNIAIHYMTGQSTAFHVSLTHVTVKKDRQLRVHMHLCQRQNFCLFDGPWHLSPKVSIVGKMFFLSSFQAFVLTGRSTVSQEECPLSYTSKWADSHKIIFKNSSVITVPSDSIFPHVPQLCVLLVQTSYKGQVNLTVDQLDYQGEESNSCKYGGFVTSQYLANEYRENPILCQNIDVRDRRSFYSSGAFLWAILYMFKPYSTLKVVFALSTTLCNSISICPCSLFLKCPFPGTLLQPHKRAWVLKKPVRLDRECQSLFIPLHNTGISAGPDIYKKRHLF